MLALEPSDLSAPGSLARFGSVLAGKFRIDGVIATGHNSIAAAATHIQLDRRVAIKFLRADVVLRNDWDAWARLVREAKAAAQLQSEHIAHVLDFGETDDGTPYIVMEYLDGMSLFDVVESRGVLDVSQAAEYAVQACEGLAEAHSHGIVHRDIKPDNLFLIEPSPGWSLVKILDFGISKMTLPRALDMGENVIVGSPWYMSPEQFHSVAKVDHRSDIWSLGVTLYQLVTGKMPFDTSLPLPGLAQAIRYAPAYPVRAFRPDLPREFAAVIERCLVKDREARFEGAAELAMALLPFAPARARSVAERAVSMRPAFPIDRDDEARKRLR